MTIAFQKSNYMNKKFIKMLQRKSSVKSVKCHPSWCGKALDRAFFVFGSKRNEEESIFIVKTFGNWYNVKNKIRMSRSVEDV